MGNEITWLDGPVMKPLFKFLTKSYLGSPLLMAIAKGIEFYGNGTGLKGRWGLKRIKWSSFKKLLLVGQSHLDAAWRWRTKQGILKARATIKKALDHIDELPNFTFSQPSPQYYQWMKDNFPDLYKRLKSAVAQGRFIPIGGSWVESDCNMPSGEAHVRQRLYGQRFYLNEFGFISDLEFLQDCFGFNRNLPQIFKKSGAKLFGTGKLFWNENTKIPLGMCHWESPDGTQLPTFHINFGYFVPITYGKEYPLIYLLGKKNQKLIASYQTPPKKFTEWRSKEYMLETAFGYGLGDGGHGPIEAEILATSLFKTFYPKIFKYYQRGDMYAMFKKYFSRWATWTDEWYLDFHRGTYTSVSRMKRGNRDSESEMEAIEKLFSISKILCVTKNNQTQENKNVNISRKILEKYWKIVLYNQFHDILPGSSIPEVYIDYDSDRKKIKEFLKKSHKKLYSQLLNSVNIQDKFGIPAVIYNPLSWSRNEMVEIEIGKYKNGVLKDGSGNELETAIVKNTWGSLEPIKEENLAITFLKEIPSMGFDVIYFDPDTTSSSSSSTSSTSINNTENSNGAIFTEDSDKFKLENKELTVEIDKKTGWINHIYSKPLQIDILKNASNKILVFKEIKHTDAWNIDPEYSQHPVEYDEKNLKITVIEKSPLRCTLEIERKIENSTFIQRISLSKESQVVNLAMDIDLKDKNWLVKLEFDTILNTNLITSEIAYSFIDRTILPTTKIDSARWEQSCHKFVSVYDENKNIGFTITNNGKYGFNPLRSKSGEVKIRPTVVRSPQYSGYAQEAVFVNRAPDGGLDPTMPKNMDLEFHRDIEYNLFIHSGDWRSEAWKKAYENNYPLRFSLNKEQNGIDDLPNQQTNKIELPYSFLKIQPDNIQCGTFKIAEDDPDPENATQFIIRLIERSGKKSEAIIQFPSDVKILNAESVDLLELNTDTDEKLTINQNRIECNINPYEIMTLEIRLTKIKKEPLF